MEYLEYSAQKTGASHPFRDGSRGSRQPRQGALRAVPVTAGLFTCPFIDQRRPFKRKTCRPLKLLHFCGMSTRVAFLRPEGAGARGS